MADPIATHTAALVAALMESEEMARMRAAEARVENEPAAAACLRRYLEAQGGYAANPTAEGAGRLSAALEVARAQPAIATLMAAQQALLARVQTAQTALWRAIGVEPDRGCAPPPSGTAPPTAL